MLAHANTINRIQSKNLYKPHKINISQMCSNCELLKLFCIQEYSMNCIYNIDMLLDCTQIRNDINQEPQLETLDCIKSIFALDANNPIIRG